MKIITPILTAVSIIGVAIISIQCASSQKIDKEVPLAIESPYFQKWMGGIEGSGYGFIIYIPVDSSSTIQLEEAYFKDKKIKLEKSQTKSVYIGKYTDPKSLKKDKDFIMDGDPKKEFGNTLPSAIEEKIPFQLKDGECIVSYLKNGKKLFFSIENLTEKELQAYPSRRPQ